MVFAVNTNGYVRDPQTGFTIQWGKNAATGETTTVTFPTAFTTCYTVVGNMGGSGSVAFEYNVMPGSWTATTLTMYTRKDSSKNFTWVAFGYKE